MLAMVFENENHHFQERHKRPHFVPRFNTPMYASGASWQDIRDGKCLPYADNSFARH